MAQTLERSVIGSAGGTSLAGGICLSYTLGEAAADASFPASYDAGFQQSSGYDQWSGGHALVTGPLDDEDHDGVPNLLEYAFGTHPLQATSRKMPTVTRDGNGQLVLTVAKGAGTSDLVWQAEVSSDLVQWTTNGITMPVNDDANFVAKAPLAGSVSFIRLRVWIVGDK